MFVVLSGKIDDNRGKERQSDTETRDRLREHVRELHRIRQQVHGL